MRLAKYTLVASSLVFVFGVNLFGDEIYTIQNKTLKEALEIISKKSNLSYIANDEILERKSIKNIQNIEGTQEALDKILEGSGLKAIIQNEAIVIVKKESKTSGTGTVLEPISVTSGKSGTAENGYLTENITGIGLWGKRSIQDTPYSMTVISEELIENTQANTMAQIFKMNPLTQDAGDRPTGNYVTVIRGFNSNNAVINGIPLADFYSFTTMEDLESVETISGATGFLYGGGRVGGAVNYVTKKPTLEDKRSIKIGNYGGEQYYGHIDLSGQIDEKNIFGYRINALYQDGDSVNDIGKEQKFASITFDFKPTDNFTMDLNYAHRDLKRTKQKLSISLSDSDSVRPILDVSKNYSPDWNKTVETNDRIMPSIKWDINDIFTLRSSLLYEKSDSKTTGDTLAYIRPDGLYDIENTKYSNQPDEFENYAGNIYLDSKFETLGVNHLLTLGYSENYYKYSIARNWFEYEDFYGIALNEIKNLPIPSAIVENSEIIPSTKTQYKNILIGDDIVFNDQWSALVGLNYATVIGTNYSDGEKISKYDKSELTPTLSLMYKPFENLTTYATYIESLEQGLIVPTQYSNANEVLDPLVSKQYEVGVKYSLLDDKLLLTSALFRIEKANQYADNATPKAKYVQDGEEIHEGIEFTITGKVTDNLTLFGGGTLMDLSVEKANDKALEGKKPTNAASKMAKLYAEYNIPFIKGLTVTGGAYYTDKKYIDRLNTDILPSYTLYDAGLRYKTKLDEFPTTFLLNVSNLTGKDYWASNFYIGDPRSIAFSMKMEF